MPHLHEKIDFTVSIFIVKDQKVLFIFHKQLNRWLPIGGHIELDENPEQAAIREAKEESGLDVELVGERSPLEKQEGFIPLLQPAYMDIHRINPSDSDGRKFLEKFGKEVGFKTTLAQMLLDQDPIVVEKAISIAQILLQR